MSRRNFSNLSSYDFEILVRDLLSENFDLRLESFAPGRDRGIDLRVLAPAMTSAGDRIGLPAVGEVPELALVVQCKHYEGSGFSKLKQALKKEKSAVARMKPQRYIVATTVSMTPDRKDDLHALLDPWLRSPADVLGREDIEELLGRFPQVEKRNYKLWRLYATKRGWRPRSLAVR
jgi:Restriction endonuclease